MAQKMEDTITSIQVIFVCQYQISPQKQVWPKYCRNITHNFFVYCLYYSYYQTLKYTHSHDINTDNIIHSILYIFILNTVPAISKKTNNYVR